MLIHDFIMSDREEILKYTYIDPDDNDITFLNPIMAEHRKLKKIFSKRCISISDDIILDNVEAFAHIPTYWDILDNKEQGLFYHGITIIEAENVPELVQVLLTLEDKPKIKELIKLCNIAIDENKYIVHFGI
ncbi:MAG: hypothetical protein E7267_02775 [Lachnospiraceae bacterium]|nr:hypothetical protein [Lachnospiraceae bacterium]